MAQKVELAELLKSATGAIDLWTAAKHKGDPRAEILKANAVAAGYLVVSRAAEIVGLWERYTSRFSFDEISLEKSRPIGRVEIATKSALIGHGAFGSVEALVSVIVHEAGHLWQIDRYPLKSNWDFDRRRDFYESEATRIRDAYMRCLGFSEDVIRILRGYSHRILE